MVLVQDSLDCRGTRRGGEVKDRKEIECTMIISFSATEECNLNA